MSLSWADSGSGFFEVPLARLEPHTVLGFDLYLQHAGKEPLLYRARNLEFTAEVRQRLVDSGVTTLLVPSEQAEAWLAYKQVTPGFHTSPEEESTTLKLVLGNRSLPLKTRGEALLGVSHNVIRTALADLGSPGLSQRVHQVTRATARFLTSEPTAFSATVSQLSTSPETYQHSANTSLYATELALISGKTDLNELTAIARAALLHDVGKGDIPAEKLYLTDMLTDLEWAEVVSHSIRGQDLMRQAGWVDAISLDVCAAHHERWDGSGYPQGMTGLQISFAARVVGIADLFDALTCHFPKRPPLSGFQALWMMRREMKEKFDPALLELFTTMLLEPDLVGR